MLKTNELYLQKVKEQQERNFQAAERRLAIDAAPALDTDLLRGFTRAAKNAQQRLALEYLIEIVGAQAAQIAELQEAVEASHADVKTSSPPAIEEDKPAAVKAVKPKTKTETPAEDITE